MLRTTLLTAFLTATTVAAVAVLPARTAHGAERTKEELAALKKVMKEWSRALGVKCNHCHNTKDFKEWTARREVGLAMSELFPKKLKPLPGTQAVTCSDCHEKSLKPQDAKVKAFPIADLSALSADFKARAQACKEEEAKKILEKVAAYLGALTP